MIKITHSAGDCRVADLDNVTETRAGYQCGSLSEDHIFITGNNGYLRGLILGNNFTLGPNSLMHVNRAGRFTTTRKDWRLKPVGMKVTLDLLWRQLEQGRTIDDALGSIPL